VLSETGTREVTPDQALTQNLAALLERVPEALWLRRSRVTLRLTERALLEGVECHVVGHLRSHEAEAVDGVNLARTGTYDAAQDEMPAAVSRRRPSAAARAMARTFPGGAVFDLHVDPGDALGFLLVSDRPPQPRQIAIGGVRIAGVALGPLLSLAGLLYLARAAELLRPTEG
jgi:hypothetical protein